MISDRWVRIAKRAIENDINIDEPKCFVYSVRVENLLFY